MYDELIGEFYTVASGVQSKRRRELLEKAADAIEELSRENESLAKSVNEASEILRKRWIPVTERLPDGGAWDRVLVYTDEGNIQTAPKCKVGNGWITHWMPLPEPPKEVDDG